MGVTYEALSTTTLTSTQANVTFDISSTANQSYTDLIIICNVKMSGANENNNIQFNNVTSGGYYSVTRLYGNGSTYSTNLSSSQDQMQLGEMSTLGSTDVIQIFNYANTNVNKTVISTGGQTGGFMKITTGLFRQTSAITNVKLFPGSGNYGIGSTFTIFGVKAA